MFKCGVTNVEHAVCVNDTTGSERLMYFNMLRQYCSPSGPTGQSQGWGCSHVTHRIVPWTDGESPSPAPPQGSPQTSKPLKKGRRGLGSQEGGVGELACPLPAGPTVMWSPDLGVQKPQLACCGKRFQSRLEPLLKVMDASGWSRGFWAAQKHV